MIVTEADGSRWLSLDAQPEPSTTTLWNDLEQVLRAKGASDKWLAYALGDLHTAALRFANAQFTRGYQAHANGDGCGAYDPPAIGS